MKAIFTIEIDLPTNDIGQMQRNGFVVHKHGSALRLKIGDKLVAVDNVKITYAEGIDNDSCSIKNG